MNNLIWYCLILFLPFLTLQGDPYETKILEITADNIESDFFPPFYHGSDFTIMVWINIQEMADHQVGLFYIPEAFYLSIDTSQQLLFTTYDSDLNPSTTNLGKTLAIDPVQMNGKDAYSFIQLTISHHSTQSEMKVFCGNQQVSSLPISITPSMKKQYLFYHIESGSTNGIYQFRNLKIISKALDLSQIYAYNSASAIELSPYIVFSSTMVVEDSNLSHVFLDNSGRGMSYRMTATNLPTFDDMPSATEIVDETFTKSLLLDHTSIKINIGEDVPQINGDFSIQFYILTWSFPTSESYFISQPSCTQNCLTIKLKPSNIFNWIGENNINLESRPNNNEWTLNTFVNDAVENKLLIYRHVFPELSYQIISNLGHAKINQDYTIVITQNNDFKIQLKEFKIWNKALSPGNIRKNQFNNLIADDYPHLIGYFKLNGINSEDLDSTYFSNELVSDTSLLFTTSSPIQLCLPGQQYFISEEKCEFPKTRKIEEGETSSFLTISSDKLNNPYDFNSVSIWAYFEGPAIADGICVLELENAFTISVVNQGTEGIKYLLDYAISTQNTELLSLTLDSWTYIAFTQSLSPFSNHLVLNDDFDNQESYGNQFKSPTNTIEIGHCSATIHTMTLVKELVFFRNYRSINQLIVDKYRTYSMDQPFLILYYSMHESQGAIIFENDYMTVTSASSNYWIENVESMYCPIFSRTMSFNYCKAPGSLAIYSPDTSFEISASDLFLEHEFTFEMIIKYDEQISTLSTLLANSDCFAIQLTSNSLIQLKLFDKNNGDLENIITTTSTLQSLHTYHLSITHKSGEIFVYLDGELDSSAQLNTKYFMMSDQSEDLLQIGPLSSVIYLRELRIWSRALSSNEIRTNTYRLITPINYWDCLTLYYPLDENSGLTLYERSTKRSNGFIGSQNTVISSSATLQWANSIHTICENYQRWTGQYCITDNHSLFFINGESSGVKIPDFELGNEYAAEFWIFFQSRTSFSPNTQYMMIQKDAHFQMEATYNSIDDLMNYRYYGQEGTSNLDGNQYLEINDLSFDAWHHLSCSNTAIFGISQITADFQKITQKNFLLQAKYYSALYIGGNQNDFSLSVLGFMKELRIWRQARSYGQITKHMNHHLNPADCPNLVGYWKMNEGDGTILYDETSNSQNLAFSNENGPFWAQERDFLFICQNQQNYDYESKNCIIPTKQLKFLSAIKHLSSNKFLGREFTIEFYYYLLGLNLEFYIANRIHIILTDTIEINIDNSNGSITISQLSDITNYPNSWIALRVSYSENNMEAKYQAYIFEDSTTIEGTYTLTQTFPEDTTTACLEIIPSCNSCHINNIRIWDKYFNHETTPEYLSELDPYVHLNLIAYWKFDHGEKQQSDLVFEGNSEDLDLESMFSKYLPSYKCNNYFESLVSGICASDPTYIQYQSGHQKVICNPYCECTNLLGNECGDDEGFYVIPENDIKFTILNPDEYAGSYSWEVNPTVDFINNGNSITISNGILTPDCQYSITVFKTKNGHLFPTSYKIGTPPSIIEGTFSVSPTSGQSLITVFTFNFGGYSDPIGFELSYELYYSFPSLPEEWYKLSESTSLTSESLLLPMGEENSYELKTHLYVRSVLGASVSETFSVTVSKDDSFDVKDYLENNISDSNSLSEYIIAHLVGSQYLLESETPDYSIDACGGCNNHGTCSLYTLNCICDSGYTAGSHCSISDQQKESELALKNSILEGLLRFEEYSDFNTLAEEGLTESLIQVLNKVLRNVKLNNFDITQKAIQILDSINSYQINLLATFSQQSIDSRISNRLSTHSISSLFEISDNVQISLSNSVINSNEDESKSLFLKNENLIQNAILSTVNSMSDDEFSFEGNSFKTKIQKLSSENLNSITIEESDDISVRVGFPNINLYSPNADDSYYLAFTNLKTHLYSLFEDNWHFGGAIDISIMSKLTLAPVSISDLSEPVHFEFLPETLKGLGLNCGKCVYFDSGSGKMGTEGVKMSSTSDAVKSLSRDESEYIGCNTNHLTSFFLLLNYDDSDKPKIPYIAIITSTLIVFILIIWILIRRNQNKVFSDNWEDNQFPNQERKQNKSNQNLKAQTQPPLNYDNIPKLQKMHSSSHLFIPIHKSFKLHKSKSTLNITQTPKSTQQNIFSPSLIKIRSNAELENVNIEYNQLHQQINKEQLPGRVNSPDIYKEKEQDSDESKQNKVDHNGSSLNLLQNIKKNKNDFSNQDFLNCPKKKEFSISQIFMSSFPYVNILNSYNCRISRIGRCVLLATKIFVIVTSLYIISSHLEDVEISPFLIKVIRIVGPCFISGIFLQVISFLISNFENINFEDFSSNRRKIQERVRTVGYVISAQLITGGYIRCMIWSLRESTEYNVEWTTFLGFCLIGDIAIQIIKVLLIFIFHNCLTTSSIAIRILSGSIIY